MITSRFNPQKPVSCAQGRYGELLIVQGGGVRPVRWTGTGAGVDAGMDAPASPPQLVLNSTPHYYVARVDVNTPGACYHSPPSVSFSTPTPIDSTKGRPAKAQSYLNQATVGEVQVRDGGKYYPTPPSIELSDTHGKGASIVAELDRSDVEDPTNNPYTGISQWTIIEHPDVAAATTNPARFAALGSRTIDITVNGNGTFEAPATNGLNGWGAWVQTRTAQQVACTGLPSPANGYSNSLRYTVSGWQSGTGAQLRLVWNGGEWVVTCAIVLNGYSLWKGATELRDVQRRRFGAGYSDDSAIRIVIDSIDGESGRIILEGYTAGNKGNTSAPRYSVRSLALANSGSGYLVAPVLKIVSESGFGAYATCSVKDGAITGVTLENGGGGYKIPPTVEILSGGAEAFAVSRPHLRGTYQCYYRFVDATDEKLGGPLPSNLSPAAEIDAGEAATSVTWTVPAPTDRRMRVELWRSTSNQALTLYRVATLNRPVRPLAGPTPTTVSFIDDLTDEELRDPDRAEYAAMPIILPNGELNANRFTPPPSDKRVVVRFQDRFWYGVGGTMPNAIYFSEVDEPESVPDVNEIILQQNARDADAIQALIPYGTTLLVMQSRHAYSLTFGRQPLLDAQVSPVAYRGALNQRCWDIYAGVCYVLDQYGVYAIDQSGGVQSLSDAIDDLFRDAIDFGKTTWSFLLIDAKTKTLRVFVPFKEDESTGYPTRVLCYSIESKTWWQEFYPHQITGGTQVQLSNGDFRCVYAATGGAYLLGEGAYDVGRGAVQKVLLTRRGAGYRVPPIVTATGGSGAKFQASINADGQLTAIWILNAGFGYTNGSLYIAPPNDPNCAAPVQAVASYVASPNGYDTPLFPVYRYRSGSAEYPSDAQNPRGGSEQSRNISLAYHPQSASCPLSLRLYYNGAKHPRHNVAERNRGVGFTHSTVDPAARIDLGGNLETYGYDTGVATALYSGRTFDDVKSSDRHVSVELLGPRKNDEPVVFYKLDVYGTADK